MISTHAPHDPLSNGHKDTKTHLAQDLRFCNQCRKTLPPNSRFKGCDACRAKARAREKRKRVNPEQAILVATTIQLASLLTKGKNKVVLMADAEDQSAPTPRPQKRKADHILNGVDEGRAENTATSGSRRAEYQTEKALLDALSQEVQKCRAPLSHLHPPASAASRRPSYVEFHGSFTIVMDPDVYEKARVKRFVAGLAKATKLPVG